MQTTGLINSSFILSGSNFYNIENITFGNNAYAEFNVLSSSEINVTVPEMAYWDYIKIYPAHQSLLTSSNKFVPVPIINNFSPVTGLTGDSISFKGLSFSGITGVYFNNILSPIVNVNSITGLTAVVPSGNTRGYVRFYGQSGVTTLSTQEFKPVALITGINPISGRTGESIDILGYNFHPEILYNTSSNNYLVSFNGATGQFSRINSNKLQGTIPPNALSGQVNVFSEVYGYHASKANFYLIHYPPTITNIVDGSGKSGNYTTIYGTNFYNVTGLRFSGQFQQTGVSITSTGILNDFLTFNVPGLTGGRYNILVQTPVGNATGTGFLLMDRPVVSGFVNLSGKVGQQIRISGLNIYPQTQVFLNYTGTSGLCQINSGTLDYTNFSYIDFYVPYRFSTSLSSGKVIIYNGVDYHSGQNDFIFIPIPRISGFTPSSGVFGSSSVISGSNFINVNKMEIGLMNISSFNVIDTTGISFVVPTGASYGQIKVYASGGVISSATFFNPLNTIPSISGGYLGQPIGTWRLFSGLNLNYVTGILYTGITGGINAAKAIPASDWFVSGYNYLTYKVQNDQVSVGLSQRIQFASSGNDLVKPANFYTSTYVTGATYCVSGNFKSDYSISQTYPGQDLKNISGKYGDRIFWSGLNWTVSFVTHKPYFKSFNGRLVSGESLQGSPNVGSCIVPREIIRGSIVFSGVPNPLKPGSEFYDTNILFTPIPTISGYSVSSATVTGGQFITITGINAYECQSYFLGITGSGFFTNIFDTGNSFGINRNFTGASNPNTGFTIITGIINSNFIGTGRMVLASKYDTQATGNFGSSVINHFLNGELLNQNTGYWSPSVLNIVSTTPSITSFNPSFGSYNQLITVYGNNLNSTTGVYLSGVNIYGTEIISSGFIQNKTNSTLTFLPQSGFSGVSGKIYAYTPAGTGISSNFYTFYSYLTGNVIFENLLRIPTGSVDSLGNPKSTLIVDNILYYKNNTGWLTNSFIGGGGVSSLDGLSNAVNITGTGNTTVSIIGQTIYVSGGTGAGEVNTASNLGNGIGIFSDKNVLDLRFYSITGATGIKASLSGNQISLSTSFDFSGNFITLQNGEDRGTVSYNLNRAPLAVLLTVGIPEGLDTSYYASVSGSPTSTSFKYVLNAPTDDNGYKLHYLIYK